MYELKGKQKAQQVIVTRYTDIIQYFLYAGVNKLNNYQ